MVSLSQWMFRGLAWTCMSGLSAAWASPSLQNQVEAFERNIAQAITEAESIPDAWTAYQFLNSTALPWTDSVCTSSRLGQSQCAYASPTTLQALKRAEEAHVIKAAKAGKGAAIKHIFAGPVSPRYTPLRETILLPENLRLRLSIYQGADLISPDDPDAKEAITWVARMTQFSPYAKEEANKQRAARLFHRSWKSGNEMAPKWATAYFIRTGDSKNAYLWSLRCSGACVLHGRDFPIAATPLVQRHLEQGISRRDAGDVQSKAANNLVTMLP